MSTQAKADQRLKAAFAFDEPPARDYAFTVGVMERVARLRLWLRLAVLAPLALAAAAVLWAVAPRLEPVAANLFQGGEPLAGAAVAALFLGAISWRLLRPVRARMGA